MQTADTAGAVTGLSDQSAQRTLHFAMICFIVLQGLDLLTTLAAFSRGGIELNPIVSSLMPWTGRAMAVVASKLVLISLVYQLSQRKRALYFANILYTAIVAWNLAIVFVL